MKNDLKSILFGLSLSLLCVAASAGAQNAAVLTNVSVSTAADNIRFMQLFFYDNTSGSSCSGTLLGVASIADNNQGQPLAVGTHTISLPAESAYSLAVAPSVGVVPGDVKCMQLYLSGNPQSTRSTSCQAFTDETCSSGTQLCTSSQSYSGTWSSGNAACRTPYFYLTSSSTAGNSLFKCTLSGGVFTCGSTGPGAFASGALGNVVNNGYGYFVSNGSSPTLYECPVTASTGAVSSSACSTQTSFAGDTLSAPRGLAISNNYLYLLDQTNLAIYGCALSTGGLVSSCTKNSISGLSITDARGITINNGYLYMAASNGIFKCTASSGSVSSCEVQSAATGRVAAPRGITVYNNNLYFVNNGSLPLVPSSVGSCSLNSNGTLNTCTNTGTAFSTPNGISIYGGVAYVINQVGAPITSCTVNTGVSPGTLSACATQLPSVGSNAVGISYF